MINWRKLCCGLIGGGWGIWLYTLIKYGEAYHPYYLLSLGMWITGIVIAVIGAIFD